MGAKILLSIMMVISICLIPTTYAECSSGIAIFRPGPFTTMSCPQYGISHILDPYAAIATSDAVWKGNQTCGTKYSIKCTGSGLALPETICPCTGESVTVTVVEHCIQQTFCDVAHATLGNITFVLSPEAFKKISNSLVPNITIEYERVYY